MFTLIQLLKLIVMSGDMDQCVTIVGHELLFFAFVDNELYFFDQNKYVCQRVRLKDLCRLKPQHKWLKMKTQNYNKLTKEAVLIASLLMVMNSDLRQMIYKTLLTNCTK